jgi:transcriptional regulator with XRE-family HTH domain
VSLDPDSSPLAFFGSELRRLREAAGCTQAVLAEATSYSLAAVSAFETARRIPSREFAASADQALSTDGILTRLQRLVESVSVLPWFKDRIEVERNAAEIREYQSFMLPGLLQTENYARVVVSAGRPVMAPDAVERAVALRLTRQQILEPDDSAPIDRDHSPRLWVIIDEIALNRPVGSTDVMRGQREHLIDMAQRPNVTIQVIPTNQGVTCAYGRAFTILTSASSSPVVYLEDARSARYIRDRDEANRYVLIFDHLRANALDDIESLKLIKDGGS